MTIIVLGIIILVIGILGLKSPELHRYKSLVNIIGVIIIVVGFVTSSLKQIDAGHVGVQVLFGKVQDGAITEGLTLVNPLFDIKQMTVQTQNYTMSAVHEEGRKSGDDAIKVLSKDGLEVILDLTILYKIVPSDAPRMYRELGLDYEDKIIRPITRTGIREGASNYDAISLFSQKREAFEFEIKNRIEGELKRRGILLEQMLVRNITLPTSVKESIERKITAIQDAQRMEFVLQKETQEAERKRVEAQGVADAQKIVNTGLSDKLLQFESIKVQKELVNSPNSKIIVLGSGKGVPFIIGNDGK